MAYSSASDVAMLTQNLLSGASTFSTSTSPTLTSVNYWLTSGCSTIETTLASEGYVVPVSSSATAYGMISILNTKFAAAWAEMSRINVRLSPGERTRGQVFLEEFYNELDRLMMLDLSRVGVVKESGANIGRPYAGGISVSDKDTVEADTDRVRPRFARGQWNFPERAFPVRTSGS